ncbi:MAG: DMT family transporter [Candidatus Heimdallarchaeota archaeon]
MSALTIFLAIFLGILSYSMLNIGLALEKKAATELPAVEKQSFFSNIKNFLTNKIWLFGFLLTSLQWFLFLIALQFGSVSLVTPMMGVGLAVLVLFSVLFLKEKLSIKELGGMLCTIIGVVILGATSTQETKYTLEELNRRVGSIEGIIFLVAMVVFVALLVLFSVLRKFAFADIAFGISGGVASGVGVIFSKAFSSAIDFSDFKNTFIIAVHHWEWWLYLVLLLAFNILSTVLPQVGFQKGKAIIVSPLFSVSALVTAVIGGVIVYSEWSNLSIGFIIGKIVALVVTITGIVILSIASLQQSKRDAVIINNQNV